MIAQLFSETVFGVRIICIILEERAFVSWKLQQLLAQPRLQQGDHGRSNRKHMAAPRSTLDHTALSDI